MGSVRCQRLKLACCLLFASSLLVGPIALGSARLRPIGLSRQTQPAAHDEEATKLERELVSVGLRTIQRQPELLVQLDGPEHDSDEDDDEEAAFESRLLDRVAANLLRQDQRRPRQRRDSDQDTPMWWEKRSPADLSPRHEFVYVIAPVSEQALPYQQEKLDQGFKNLVALGQPSYRVGLEKAGALDQDAGVRSPSGGLAEPWGSCRPIRSKLLVSRDEIDPVSGQPVRHCTGQVELNTCDGYCGSSELPSVKTASGFVKHCSCCNERTFRRVQIRLDECRQAPGGQLVPGHMEVSVDEPVDCKCRPCDSVI